MDHHDVGVRARPGARTEPFWTRVGAAVVVLLAGGACEPPIPPPEPTPPDVDPVSDHDGPWLETVPITEPQSLADPIVVDAVATDPSGIYAVFLHYRPQNAGWESLRMEPVGDEGYFVAEIDPADLQGASSVSYYLEAADATPYHNTTYSPSSGPEAPYRFNLLAE